jgi:DNA ligase-1
MCYYKTTNGRSKQNIKKEKMRKKPMLAYPVSDKQINYDDKVFIQPKLDGVRCVIQFEPHNNQHNGGVVKAYSRTGKEWKNIDHILFNLRPWFQLNPNVILDGELYNHDLKDDFEKIISLVRKQKPTDIDALESADMVQFHCYDIIDETKTFDERNTFIEQVVPRNHCIKHVPTNLVFRDDDAKVYHRRNLNNGYEGSILRTNDVYKCGRSWSLRKFKDFHDTEATIIGYVDGKGKRTGTLGKFIMQDDEGVEFGCPPGKGYTYKDLANMLDNIGDYIGQRATFTFFERTKAGSYRHPLFKCIRNYE